MIPGSTSGHCSPAASGNPPSISIVKINDDIDEIQMGYCIGQKWWHQGYTSEALEAVIRFAFTELGANRVAAIHNVQNPHSGGVMQKCGMQKETGSVRSI